MSNNDIEKIYYSNNIGQSPISGLTVIKQIIKVHIEFFNTKN